VAGHRRGVLLVFGLLAALSGSLALRAWLLPPKGTVFVGTFYYVDDFYNYLSYVEQAERGALVFRNKLADPSLPPALVNLEWLAVGRLSSLLGGRPLLAYRLFGLVALAALVLGLDHWLARSGLPPGRRLAGLLLVGTGGGLGGILLAFGLLPGPRALDVRTGAFPFVESLANPHFVAGTALLLAALGAYAAGRGGRGVALGTVLGLVRPYDAALLAGIEGLAVLLSAPARDWARRLVPVLGLLPVLAYDAWVLLAGPGFSAFSSPRYAAVAPRPVDLALALGPAAVLALAALRVWGEEEGAPHRLRLALWTALALGAVVLRPVSFSLQFLVGLGVPLLVLAAVGLARLPRGVLESAVPLMATSAAVVTWLCATPSPGRHVPAGRWGAALALREACRPGDLALAPEDIGLYVGGLSPCWPYVSHAAAADHDVRAAAVRRFYGEAAPEERAAFLDRACVAHVVLPPGAPPGWLGAQAPFRPRAAVGAPGGGLVVATRDGAASCRAPAASPPPDGLRRED
jgi:hypothetical protein